MNHIIKVTLAEDGDALRRSLADSLREQPDIQVLDEAADGEELVAVPGDAAGRGGGGYPYAGHGRRRSLQNPPVGTAGSQAADPHHL